MGGPRDAHGCGGHRTHGARVAVTVRLALFRGEDEVGIERAIEALAEAAADGGAALTKATLDAGDGSSAADRASVLGQLEERLLTMPLFGGGALVVVRRPASLLRDQASQERLLRLLAAVPAGQAFVLVEVVELRRQGNRVVDSGGPLATPVREAGGEVQQFPAPLRQEMLRWLGERATELGVTLEPAAARLLAERLGADRGDGDMDRRNQTQLAWSALTNLALLRPDGTVTAEDVAALVPETIPASRWAFLDAIGQRRAGDAAVLAERLLEGGWAIQVLTTLLHRRLRELITARDLADRRRPAAELVRLLATSPKRAEIVASQAARWDGPALRAALEGLLELDLSSKGLALDGSPVPSSEARSGLALQAWIAERVAASSSTRPLPG